jgi:hypothetical protein
MTMQTTVDGYSSATTARTISLWSPRVITICTVLFNVPAGLTLALINWKRMGQHGKALAAALGVVVAACVFIALSAEAVKALYLANIGVALVLRKRMEADIALYTGSEGPGETASWGVGVLIALGITLLLGVAMVVL